MPQYSVFFVSLLAAILLWGSDNGTLFFSAIAIAIVAAALSVTSRIYAIRQARERRSKAISGLRLRKRPPAEIEEMAKKPITLKESDYEFVPGWITYVSMGLALIAVLLLSYGVVLKII